MTSIELHSFSDASIKAFAAAVYLRLESKDNVSTTLAASKTRVAPLKQQSLPRLELLGALISSRLASAVERAVSSCIIINSVYCWTDSIIALFWIKGVDKEFKQFLENRVAGIRKKTDTSSWNHIAGKDNPSDLPTRGLQLGEFLENDHWWHGPSWLSLPKDCWPQPLSKLEPTTESIAEMKKECKKSQSEVNLFSAARSCEVVNLENIICSSDYSSILKLFRVTAFMLRFMNNLRSRSRQQERNVGPLNPPEILKAEHAWLQTVQQQFIVGDPKFKMLQKSLGLFYDENKILHCKGRISNANLPYVTKFPAILPKDHHLTSLIIHQSHERVMHNGVKETLCSLRQKYWIARRCQVVKRKIHMCSVCRS